MTTGVNYGARLPESLGLVYGVNHEVDEAKLFPIYFDTVFSHAFLNSHEVIYIKYQTTR